MTQIETPCVRICAMDSAGRACIGCGRTLDEIARWGSMTSAQRTEIMRALPARLAARADSDRLLAKSV